MDLPLLRLIIQLRISRLYLTPLAAGAPSDADHGLRLCIWGPVHRCLDASPRLARGGVIAACSGRFHPLLVFQ
jgi:hypothetical protein